MSTAVGAACWAAAIRKAAQGLPPCWTIGPGEEGTTAPGTVGKGFSELIVPAMGAATTGSLLEEVRRFDSVTLNRFELASAVGGLALAFALTITFDVESITETGRSDAGLTRTALVITVVSRGALASVISPALFT